MNKSGQGGAILGFLLIAVVVGFILYLLAVPMSMVWSEVSDKMKEPEAFGNDNLTVEKIEQVDSFMNPLLDQIVFISFIGLMLVLLVVGIFTDIHPVFTIFLFIGLIIVVILGSQLVNVADEAVNDPALGGAADSFTLSNILFGSFFMPVIILLIGTVVIIMAMSKRGGGGG